MNFARGIVFFALVGCVFLIHSCVQAAFAQQPPRWNTEALINLGKEEGKLPTWFDAQDGVRTVTEGFKVYACLTDAQSSNRWVAATNLSKVRRYLDGYPWLSSGEGVPITSAEWALCFPDIPFPQAGPVALGEPVYRFIAHTRPAREAPLDWASMNADGVMGQTVAGQPCGNPTPEISGHTDPAVGWYSLPAGGMTRCRR